MRILLYSPDSYGLGHVRRSTSLAAAVLEQIPNSSALLLTGAPRAHYFDYPRGCDYVKLPSMTKDDAGSYVSRELDLSSERTVHMREGLIRISATDFAPDVFLVDHSPLGLGGEVLPTLRKLGRSRPQTLRVLGMRDVIDDPAAVRAAWKRDNVIRVLREYYDQIVVYGQRDVFDPIEAYRIPDDVAAKMTFVGYIDRSHGNIDVAEIKSRVAPRTGQLVVVTLGGGGDGNLTLRTFLNGYAALGDNPPFEVVAVTGPLMSPGKRERFRETADATPGLTLLEYTAEMPELIGAADFVVSMGGYNTVCELAGAGARALIVPRCFPRKEQLLRAQLLSQRGVVRHIEEEQIEPARVMREVLRGLESPRPAIGWGLNFGALEQTPTTLAQSLCPPQVEIASRQSQAGAYRMRLDPGRLLLMLLIALLLPLSARAGESRLGPGTWVSIKGTFDQSLFRADEIDHLDEHSASIKGALDRFSPDDGEMQFGTLVLSFDERVPIKQTDGTALSARELSSGQRVKVSLEGKNLRRARRVRVLDGDVGRLRIEGPIEALRQDSDATRLTVLGVEIVAGPTTSWDGVTRARVGVGDEDARPARGIHLGKLGRLSGELRLDYKGKENFDLTDQIDSNLDTGRARARVELTFPSTRHVSGMLQIKGQNEREIDDETDTFGEIEGLTLGQSYVLLSGILGQHGSLQVGRSRFDDQRDWLFNRDADALRLFFDFARVQLEASISEEVINPVEHHEDIQNILLSASLFPGRHHIITAYWLDRDDGFRDDGDLRDFSPRLTGIRATGEDGKTWSYWIEAALAQGSLDGEKLDGHAIDVGLSLVGPWSWEPSFTIAYAMGSGDDDPFDGVNHTFRQSGMQLNNGKWNGVSSFRYYGELMRPELANLHVQTYGVGIRPKRRTSIDVIYHRYDLDQPAPELIDAAFDDRALNLVDRYIGQEWDLVLGYEELAHLEFEFDFGYFIPGDAFLGPTDRATTARLKVKYVF